MIVRNEPACKKIKKGAQGEGGVEEMVSE